MNEYDPLQCPPPDVRSDPACIPILAEYWAGTCGGVGGAPVNVNDCCSWEVAVETETDMDPGAHVTVAVHVAVSAKSEVT